MGAFYYAIPINRNSSVIGAAEMSALNSLVVEAISYGEYDMGTSDDNFQQSRSAPCQQILNSAASNNDGNIPSLSFQQMAGVFFIQACGLFFSLIIHFTLSSRGCARSAGAAQRAATRVCFALRLASVLLSCPAALAVRSTPLFDSRLSRPSALTRAGSRGTSCGGSSSSRGRTETRTRRRWTTTGSR